MTEKQSLVSRFAEHVVNLRYEDIPPEAVQLAKWLVFDTIGTALGGYQRERGQKAVRFARMRPGVEQATILGDGVCRSVEDAAFANAVMGKILGMDDSHRTGGHIASQVIPAVLAVGEVYGTSGKEMITAIVGSYDLAVRVASSVRSAQRERGLDLKGTVGAMAAAAAAARCAGLDIETTRHAISMAADLGSGTEQYVYEGGLCDTKDLIAGFAARNGVFAMMLAQAGFHGPDGALDGEYGFFRAFGGGGFDPADYADLGSHFAIVGTAFKPHGGCRHTHQAVDAVQRLLAESPINPDDIARVQIDTYTSAITPSFRIDPNPPSRDVAGLSIRVATAVALTQHSAWPDDYVHWDTPTVRRLRNLVEVAQHPEIDTQYPVLNGCNLSVTLNSGETHAVYLPNMKGEPEFRMTEDELITKFHNLTRELFDGDRARRSYGLCDTLEAQPSVHELVRLAVVEG